MTNEDSAVKEGEFGANLQCFLLFTVSIFYWVIVAIKRREDPQPPAPVTPPRTDHQAMSIRNNHQQLSYITSIPAIYYNIFATSTYSYIYFTGLHVSKKPQRRTDIGHQIHMKQAVWDVWSQIYLNVVQSWNISKKIDIYTFSNLAKLSGLC